MSAPTTTDIPSWPVADDPEAWLALAEEKGIGDGLPLIPPTPDRLAAWLDVVGREPSEALGVVPPRQGTLTVAALAINSIMAGARPNAFPILVSAFEAMFEPRFNLLTTQVTTNPIAPLVMVSGPAAAAAGMNGGEGYLGPGNRANATIGRAVRLTLMNVGGARPGVADRATAGQAAKYTLAFAENETDSPWDTLATSQGVTSDSAVVAFGAVSLFSHLDSVSSSAEDLLDNLAQTLTARGTNVVLGGGEVLVLLCPEHARLLDRAGMRRADVQHELFERSRTPLGNFPSSFLAAMRRVRADNATTVFDGDSVRVFDRPDDVLLAVAGGAGKHSVTAASIATNRSVAQPVSGM